MAARTASEILLSFQQSVAISDATVDTQKGPMYSLIGRPLSQVLAPFEFDVDRLNKIYSVEFAQVATPAEAQAFLTNWGEAAGTGTPSTVRVFFMTFTRPRVDQVLTIDTGTLVGNYDQTLQYITVESGEIRGDIADTYYNAQRRAYEIPLQCQAVAVGTQYELPRGRIITKVSPLPDIDAVENREMATPGESAETLQQQITRVQQKFFGLAINTGNGSFTRIKRMAPTSILDIKTVLPTDIDLFKRLVYGPAKDYYILGNVIKTAGESYKATGGETEIFIQNVPALSVSSVMINNVSMSNFALRSDTTPQLGGSARAQDKLVLAFPLLANDVVTYQVTYDGLIQNVQQQLNETYLFNTDELARRFNKIPVRIEITGRSLTTYDPVQVENEVRQVVESLLTPGVWQETFYPRDFLEAIRKNVSGISNTQLIRFQRATGYTSTNEVVVMKRNEIAVYDSSYVNVLIRTV